jgi:hypothetical protein
VAASSYLIGLACIHLLLPNLDTMRPRAGTGRRSWCE